MNGLAPRLVCKIQITTDGLHANWDAIDVEKGSDYAVCKKITPTPAARAATAPALARALT
jgi:hypothetical protein